MADTHNDPYRRSTRTPVLVTLTCGCKLPCRNRPVRKSTTYPCPSGKGHGYQVGWARWEEGDHSGTPDQYTR